MKLKVLGKQNESRIAVRELNGLCSSSQGSAFVNDQPHRQSKARSFRNRTYFKFLMAFTVIGALLLQTASAVTLAWNPSSSPNVTGYMLYYGKSSRSYSDAIPTSVASAAINNLTEGVTYYFSVTALDSLGLESGFSNEISYTVPSSSGRPTLKLLISPSKQVVLRITGQLGRTYEIQSSTNLTNWSVVGVVALGVSVTLDYTDTAAAGKPVRYYRLRQIL